MIVMFCRYCVKKKIFIFYLSSLIISKETFHIINLATKNYKSVIRFWVETDCVSIFDFPDIFLKIITLCFYEAHYILIFVSKIF